MKRKLKLLLLSSLFFYSFFARAQTGLKAYYESEKQRISQVRLTEIEIEKFISNNFRNYALTPSVVERLKSKDLQEKDINVKPNDLEITLLNMKKAELRKLFFVQHPDKVKQYVANPLPVELSLTCVNGDFENDVTANYTFFTDKLADSLECNVERPIIPITPTVNDFSSLATVIDSGDSSWDSTTMQFDPMLNSAIYGNVQVPTISPNGGNSCIKLNNADGLNDVTTMSRQILINDAAFEYELSLMLQASGHLTEHREPIFTVKFYDLNDVLIQERCIISEPNCIFNMARFTGDRAPGQNIYYTDWICDRIDVSALVDKPVVDGVNARVEFTIADCGVFNGGHFGTVYIDNICGFTCESPSFGSVNASPANSNCPDFINASPYQICGSYVLSSGSVLNDISIEMSTDGLIFTPLNPLEAAVNIDLFNQTFCFDIAPAILGIGTYTFRITETYDQTCALGTFPNANTTLVVADFTDCCLPTAFLTSPNEDVTNLSPLTNLLNPLAVRHIERDDWIKASNIIGVGDGVFQNGVVYHAENYIEMNPGFEAQYGSQFVAYPLGCQVPDTYIYRQHATNTRMPKEESKINLIKVSGDIEMYPNPSNKSITIATELSLKRINIMSIDGKLMFERNADSSLQQIDISSYAKGIYIVNLTLSDGQIISKKLIKN